MEQNFYSSTSVKKEAAFSMGILSKVRAAGIRAETFSRMLPR